MRFFLVFLAMMCASSPGFSQETPPTEKKLIAFAGYVQHIKGNAEAVLASGESSPLKFASGIYEGTRIKTESDAQLKIVTSSGCIAVFYGAGVIQSPQGEKPWQTTTTALRLICSAPEKFIFHGLEIAASGESLIQFDGRILVVTGRAHVASEDLVAQKIYQYAKGSSKPMEDLGTDEIYTFDTLYKIPKEGAHLKRTEKTAHSRIQFGVDFGRAITLHANGLLNHYDYKTSANPSLQYTFKSGEGGIIIGVHMSETKSKDDTGGCLNCGSTDVAAYDDVTNIALDLGYRSHFQKWWSPFVRAGLFWEENKMQVGSFSQATCLPNVPCNGTQPYNEYGKVDYFGLSAAIGLDAFLRPSWLGGFGFYGALELAVFQTVVPTSNTVAQSGYSPNASIPGVAHNENGFLTLVQGLASVGILYQF